MTRFIAAAAVATVMAVTACGANPAPDVAACNVAHDIDDTIMAGNTVEEGQLDLLISQATVADDERLSDAGFRLFVAKAGGSEHGAVQATLDVFTRCEEMGL